MPCEPCPACGSRSYWQPQASGAWHCSNCSPSTDPLCTTLLLASGPLRSVTPAPSRQDLDRARSTACRGLPVDRERLLAWLAQTPGTLHDFVQHPEFGKACVSAFLERYGPTQPRDTGTTAHGAHVLKDPTP